MGATPRYRLFGVLRFVLALLVIFQHYGRTLAGPGVDKLASQTATGAVAVQMFFALSGFIILEAALTFYLRRPVAFLLNRAIRILIPFWIVVISTWVIYAIVFRYAGSAGHIRWSFCTWGRASGQQPSNQHVLSLARKRLASGG